MCLLPVCLLATVVCTKSSSQINIWRCPCFKAPFLSRDYPLQRCLLPPAAGCLLLPASMQQDAKCALTYPLVSLPSRCDECVVRSVAVPPGKPRKEEGCHCARSTAFSSRNSCAFAASACVVHCCVAEMSWRSFRPCVPVLEPHFVWRKI